jgi:hypothetical protein
MAWGTPTGRAAAAPSRRRLRAHRERYRTRWRRADNLPRRSGADDHAARHVLAPRRAVLREFRARPESVVCQLRAR